MSSDLITLPEDMDPRAAFEALNTARRRLAPIVDKSGKLTGIITRVGALRARSKALSAEVRAATARADAIPKDSLYNLPADEAGRGSRNDLFNHNRANT